MIKIKSQLYYKHKHTKIVHKVVERKIYILSFLKPC